MRIWRNDKQRHTRLGSSSVFNIAFEREGKKTSYYKTGYSYFGSYPNANPAEQSLTLLINGDKSVLTCVQI